MAVDGAETGGAAGVVVVVVVAPDVEAADGVSIGSLSSCFPWANQHCAPNTQDFPPERMKCSHILVLNFRPGERGLDLRPGLSLSNRARR